MELNNYLNALVCQRNLRNRHFELEDTDLIKIEYKDSDKNAL